MIPFIWHLERAKTTGIELTNDIQGLRERGGFYFKRAAGMREFYSNGTILYPNCGGGFMVLCVCQESELCAKRHKNFTVWVKKESVKAYLIWNYQRIQINIYWVPIMSRAWIGRYEENKASLSIPSLCRHHSAGRQKQVHK